MNTQVQSMPLFIGSSIDPFYANIHVHVPSSDYSYRMKYITADCMYILLKNRRKAIEEKAEKQWESLERSQSFCWKQIPPKLLSGGPVPRNAVTETDLTCIHMSVIRFLSRNYSENADENVVSDTISDLFCHNTIYEVVSKIFRNDALPTSTQLHATGSLDMVVLPSTCALHYHNCCMDGCTSPECFGCPLICVVFVTK
jgi:hypothetical protein